ncbi:MAG: serine hydrolase [Woeseia sp.]
MLKSTLPAVAAMFVTTTALAADQRPPSIEEDTDATVHAYAAGYVAGYTCSAVFNGDKSAAQIREHELTGIYPVVADIVADLSADVDRDRQRVSVTYADDMPPRIAQWRPHLGCVDLPVGAGPDAAKHIPSVSIDAVTFDARRDDGKPWTTRAPVNGSSGNDELDGIIEQAFAKAYGRDSRTTAVLVATPDAIIAERYIDGYTPTTSQRTWSVAKSIAASVIGAAVQQGLVDIKAPADVPEWRRAADPRGKITLEHLLHMASGLDSNVAGNRTDRIYMGGGLVADSAATRAVEVRPGERWKYANIDTLLAVRAMRSAFANDDAFLRFPFEAVLYRIGMTHTKLETDWGGDFILSSQVWTTSRDLARLGVLHLQDGVWDGERILPEDWVEYVSRPAPSQPVLENDDGSPRAGYGAQWWLFDRHDPAIPSDAFAAFGNRGQYLVVIPSLDVVIIRRGYDMAGGEGFSIDRFTADVLQALAAN